MKYFKNTELAKLYHVSEKSVRNWIESSQQGKLDLELYRETKRSYITNTSRNIMLIEQLVEKGVKYKNKRGLKEILPAPKFYATYSKKQIFDIISNIEIHREIPLQYTYVDGGARYWDSYAHRLADEETPNMLTSTMQLLESDLDNIDRLIGNRRVNIVDLGPGNGLPIKNLLDRFIKEGRLKRYIGIDVSQEMLSIAKRNIREWFGDNVAFEGHVRDLSHERFDDLLAQDYERDDTKIPVNLVLLLGGTLNNLRSPDQALQAINNSLNPNDVLIYSTKLDTPTSRRYFDFNISSHDEKLTPRHRLTLDLLNIDKSLYEVDQFFDEQQRARFISVRLNVALLIKLDLTNGTRRISLYKDDHILLWRYWHHDTLDIINLFDKNDFDLMQVTKSEDKEYLLLTTKIKITR